MSDQTEQVGFHGKRHPLKAKRWEVVKCHFDPTLVGRWLDWVAAKGLLEAGDFYPDYTRIRICPPGIEVTVKGSQIFDEDGDVVIL